MKILVRTRVVFGLICFLMLGGRSLADESEAADLVRQYLASLQSIQTIQGKAYWLLPPAEGKGPWMLKDSWRISRESEFRFSRDGGLSWERQTGYFIDVDDGTLGHSNTEHGYDGDSFFALDFDSKRGMISTGDGGKQMPPLTNPLDGFGSGMVPKGNVLVDLWDAVEQSQVTLGDESNQFVLDSPFGMSHNRVKVTLNPDDGYLPSRIDVLQRRDPGGPWRTIERREVTAAVLVDGVYVPTECLHYRPDRSPESDRSLVLQSKLIVVPDTLEVNVPMQASDFQVEYSDDIEYHDFRDGVTRNPHDPTLTPVASQSWSWWQWFLGGNAIVIVSVLIYVFWRNRQTHLVLIALLPLISQGCDSRQADRLVEVDGSREHRVKLTASEFVSHREVFVIKNTSNQLIEFGGIVSSCGCTSAKVLDRVLAPGESTEVSASIVREHFVTPKSVSLQVPMMVETRLVENLILNVFLEPESDWASSRSAVKVDGTCAQYSEFDLRLSVRNSAMSSFAIAADSKFQLQRVDIINADSVDLAVRVQMPVTAGVTNETLIIRAPPGLRPDRWEVDVSLHSKPPGRWEPSSALLYKQSGMVSQHELMLDPGVKITRIDSSEGFKASCIDRNLDEPRVFQIASMDSIEHPTGWIDAVISKDNLEWPVRLLVVCRD